MPLMGKKPPTPQDMYKARKQREEEERDALLPPGLINHGNTCFMNSVLQGLIATPMLSDIVRFSLPESYLPVSSRRSPQLTNGHRRGGEWEREWERGMELGDVFIALMERAWKCQDERRRVNLTPRDILRSLGKKYDQYLDFRQQDAHELLRHLLDAMRMEEFDVIKRRQPPPPKTKTKRKRRNAIRSPSTSLNGGEASTELDPTSNPVVDPELKGDIPESGRLTSFVDMVFGGTLASILVCEKCKKVSCTYEDFNDLSLSIKPEDYAVTSARAKAWRRERLKGFARKLKMPVRRVDHDYENDHGIDQEGIQHPQKGRSEGTAKAKAQKIGLGLNLQLATSGAESDTDGNPIRPSSVPTSPTRRSIELERVVEQAVGNQQRRRSLELDAPRIVTSEHDGGDASTASTSTDEASDRGRFGPDERRPSRHRRDGANVDDYDIEIISTSEGVTPADERWQGVDVAAHEKTETPPASLKEHVTFKEDRKRDKVKRHKEKDEDEDGWVKLGRKISMGLTPKKEKRKSKEASRDVPKRTGVGNPAQSEATKLTDRTVPNTPTAAASIPDVKDDTPGTPESSVLSTAAATPPQSLSSSALLNKLSFHRRPSPSRSSSFMSAFSTPLLNSAAHSAVSTPALLPSSPLARPIDSPYADPFDEASAKHVLREKQKAKMKHSRRPSREEGAYLRRLFADVPSSSSSPFNVFRSGATSDTGNGSTSGLSSGHGFSSSLNFLSRLGNVQSVEDCLRMFSAVEVLEGENMYRCHRCWKIQNGSYDIRRRTAKMDDEDSSSSCEDEGDEKDEEEDIIPPPPPPHAPALHVSDAALVSSPASTGVALNSALVSTLDLNEDASVHSAPTTLQSTFNTSIYSRDADKVAHASVERNADASGTAYNVSVPSISMTAPESSQSLPAGATHSTLGISLSGTDIAGPSPHLQSTRLTSPSKDSLQLPTHKVRQTEKRQADRRAIYVAHTESSSSPTSDAESDDDSSDESSMSVSLSASARSSTSSLVLARSGPPGIEPPSTAGMRTPATTPRTLEEVSHAQPRAERRQKPSPVPSIPRSKQVISRRAYKRYLIASPPPVLVIHLKRFQQVGKAPTQMPFFTNFKKLDDPVGFPEYLDLAPFLTPRREDFGLKRSRRDRSLGLAWGGDSAKKEKGERRCMYRLYAVVVHIGNMLGGHYVAYTALPESAEQQSRFPNLEKPDATSPNLFSPPPEQSPEVRRPALLSRTTSFENSADPRYGHKLQGSSRKWCYISDTVVRLTTLEEVMKAKAYICMYERI